MSPWFELKKRAAGTWRLPLLIISSVFLVHTMFRLRPAPTELSFEKAIPFLEREVEAGFHQGAIDLGNHLLAREGITSAQQRAVHLQMARAQYGLANEDHRPTSGAGAAVIQHYQSASRLGFEPQAGDRLAMGRAFEWQGKFAGALEQYDKSLTLGIEHPLDLRRHMLQIKMKKLGRPAREMESELDAFLADVGEDRLDLRLWAIERELEVYDDLDKLQEASTLLARDHPYFSESAFRDRFAYLEAWLLYRTGHHDEAETRLRTIRNRLDEKDEVHAMTGWLLGRVVLRDDGPERPMEALSFFNDVMERHDRSPYAVASRIGAAEALVALERHGEAIEAFRLAIEDLDLVKDRHLVDRGALRTTLGVLGEVQRREGHLVEAVEYTRLAAGLIDPDDSERASLFLQQFGETQVQLAESMEAEAPKPSLIVEEPTIEARLPKARAMFAEAASTYLTLARINAMNDERGAGAVWRAADLFARAGRREKAVNLYQTFVQERPHHPFVPRSLLRIGQIHQLSGDLSLAVDSYRECYRRFPRTLDGARALIPLAKCYLALGPEYADSAEKTLRIVLEESEVFTPVAPEFRDALFLFGDGLNRTHQYNRAIAALEEALERYPRDPRALRARYLLADSYRKSGLALKAGVKDVRSPGEIEQIRAESKARFQAARKLYRELIDEYELRSPARLSPLERMYRRHAYLYEADCYFETRQYRQALKRYEEAAGLFKDHYSALAAYVQIINGHVFLGEPEEARAALARAKVLVDSMPEQDRTASVSPETREDWKRYFDWIEKSELF